jgi:hypothetical protein
MADASIRIENEKLVPDDLVSLSKQIDAGDAGSLDDVSILYLEGTAKALDRLINELYEDRDGIESVRFGLATEMPIRNLAMSLQRPVDPTTVRQSTSWIVEAEDAAVSRALTRSLGDRATVRLSADVAESGMNTTLGSTDGPDVMSQMFILVR